MSAGAPWSVKGIDPKARELAKDLARRQGLTLGDWLNRMIEDTAETPASPAAPVAPEPPRIAADELSRLRQSIELLGLRVESAEHRSSLAISGIDQTVLGLLSRLEAAEREQTAVAARFEGAVDELKSDHARAAERLAKVEDSAAQPRSLEALRALETALGKVASHLYDSETRTREDMTAIRQDLGGLAQRVGHLEASDVPPSQAMIDGVVSRIVQRLEEAEARTTGVVRGLEASVAEFDQRLRATESRIEAPESRLEQLAADLTRNMEASRAELAQKLEGAVDERLTAMERSLKTTAAQVQASEQRSTQAMERFGREVLRVAEGLGQRMEGVEARSAETIGKVGGEVTRIAEVMEHRLRHADHVQAESLERLGAEIARITERLAERIANAERRSAQAIDDVGEQVSRITERFNQRHERSASDLAERIRQSEERTARLLEEARDKLDQRLAASERRLSEQVGKPAPASGPVTVEPVSPYAEPDLPPGPFGRDTYGSNYARRGGGPAGYVPPVESLPPEAERSPFDADDFDPAEMLHDFDDEAPGEQLAQPAEDDFHQDAGPAPVAGGSQASTRELIAQARAAARAASQQGENGGGKSLFGGFGAAKKDKKASKLRRGMTVSAAAALLGVSAAGLVLFDAQRVNRGAEEDRSAAPPAPASTPGPAPAAAPAQAAGQPQAAVALAPQALVQPAPAASDPASLYADAVRRIEAKDAGGMAGLRRAADLGYGPAQFYLAKLYEAGEAGMPKDVVQARRWTERAAQSGDRKAMHNLALYYFEGTGGAKDAAAAAQWFHKAADLGLVDSQFNLARLYEGGFGVPENPAEAYKWYLIASRSGDAESKSAAARLKSQLSPSAEAQAETAAAAFRPQSPTAPQTAVALAAPAVVATR